MNRMTARETNLLLEVLIAAALVTGVGSWIVGLSFARPLTLLHALVGLMLLIAAPAKMRGSVKTGFRRGRRTRWLSTAFGILVLGAIALGAVHTIGLWFGVGYWSALWTHQLFGFVLIPLLLWHVWTRPVRPSVTDLNRRSLLSAGTAAAIAAAVVGTQEALVRISGLTGAERSGTGSYETGSFDPDRMPTVSWIDDRAPDIDVADWPLLVAGEPVDVAELAAASESLPAVLDCTGGWWSEQNWDVIPLAAVLPTGVGRSVKVTSATGYSRLFSTADLNDVYLATGYDRRPLRRGHGAPIRIVAPGRRGPWWIKWVTTIEISDRPAWLQLPLPPT
jgi:hypothetical protein